MGVSSNTFPRRGKINCSNRGRNEKKRNPKKVPSGEGKRSVKKVKKDLEKLGELVGLMQQSGCGGNLNIAVTNSNLMGGRNSRQAAK